MRLLLISIILGAITVGKCNAFVISSPSKQPLSSPHLQKFSSKSTTRVFSDVPRMEEDERDKNDELQQILDWRMYLPPPPEDQFILTGDISVLFLYGFTSHFLNNFVVESVMANSNSIQDALNTLDPMGDVVMTQNPVWVQPEMVDTVLTINAQESLLNHWGPLYSTAGSACVALCSSWLLAGWLHKAFLFQNSLDCSTSQALQKTFETWISTAIIMFLLTMTSNTVVGHVPLLQEWLGCASCHDYVWTKADGLFVADSATVLIAWRFMASTMMKWFR